MDDVMLRQTERLAQAGHLTLMPDLFAEGGVRRCLVPTMRAATSGRGRAWADLEAARQTLAGHPDRAGRVGVIGFCMGGRVALVAAGRSTRHPSTTASCPRTPSTPSPSPARLKIRRRLLAPDRGVLRRVLGGLVTTGTHHPSGSPPGQRLLPPFLAHGLPGPAD
ncbi:hypothetical protein GCM10010344_02890 [Streptomyces bluensis]|nr:hypothetical protein GCM10010344_02890 [Streptomyces bluensis]